MSLILLLILIILGSYAVYRSQQGYRSESLRGPSGTVYLYRMGDYLPYFHGGTFRGIDIALPTVLPNIFLDGKIHEGNRGPRHFYDSKQALKLEGNFNTYFTLYVPEGYQVLALSILTPDVMEILMSEVPDCDVELYKDHFRIIVRHKLNKRPRAQIALLKASETILEKIDSKLRSWSEADSREAENAVLKSEDNPTVKFFGKRMRTSTLLITPFFGFFCLLAWPVWLYVMAWSGHLSGVKVTLEWWLEWWWPPFLIFPVLWILLIIGLPRDWPRRIRQKFSRRDRV